MDLLKRRKVIKNYQIFNIKFDNHYKSQFVVKEFSQAEEIDFDELFSLVVCYEILCLFLAIAILEDWNIYSINVKTAYFYNNLDEKIHMEQSKGFRLSSKERKSLVTPQSIIQP